jgi:hypothetical protein
LFDNDDGNINGGGGSDNENSVQARLFIALISV